MTTRRRGGAAPALSPIAHSVRDALIEAGLRLTPRQLSIAVSALLDQLDERCIDIVHEQPDPRRR
jgi:hypothetical protein